jgi:hypothetical protein
MQSEVRTDNMDPDRRPMHIRHQGIHPKNRRYTNKSTGRIHTIVPCLVEAGRTICLPSETVKFADVMFHLPAHVLCQIKAPGTKAGSSSLRSQQKKSSPDIALAEKRLSDVATRRWKATEAVGGGDG